MPKPSPTPSPSAAPTSFPSLTPTASQAPTRKGSITWAHVGEDVEVRGLGMHKFTANADNSVMFFFAGYHDDCDDGARAAKMAADPPTNDAAWNNASYCLYPNGNGISAGRWPPTLLADLRQEGQVLEPGPRVRRRRGLQPEGVVARQVRHRRVPGAPLRRRPHLLPEEGRRHVRAGPDGEPHLVHALS